MPFYETQCSLDPGGHEVHILKKCLLPSSHVWKHFISQFFRYVTQSFKNAFKGQAVAFMEVRCQKQINELL